jgi:hypothetical protein
MKSVHIASLPLTPDNILAQVLLKPSYNFIQYAAASDNISSLTELSAQVNKSNLWIKGRYENITFSLTNAHQYFFVVKSHIGQRSFKMMWTRTTTTANNKNQFVTLIISFNKFDTRTPPGTPTIKWYGLNSGPVISTSDHKKFNQ